MGCHNPCKGNLNNKITLNLDHKILLVYISNLNALTETPLQNELSGWHGCSSWYSWKMLCPSDQPNTHGTFLEGTWSTPLCD